MRLWFCPECAGLEINEKRMPIPGVPMKMTHWMCCLACGFEGPACNDSCEARKRWNALPRLDFNATQDAYLQRNKRRDR